MISSAPTLSFSDIFNIVSEANILAYYIGIREIPCTICSPLREDKNPSFGLYTIDGKKVLYKDFSTGDKGGTIDLLCKLWGKSYKEVLSILSKECKSIPNIINSNIYHSNSESSTKNNPKIHVGLECVVREFEEYDYDYWSQYGITKEWLNYAEIYPIKTKIINKNGKKFLFGADKYAYVSVEHKEKKVTLKIYQPFNKKGYKWANSHDSSVIGLWTKIPSKGKTLIICSSLKDALCLWANTGIPCIYIQGEGYSISNTALNVLKSRYENIYILLDNDDAGIKNGERLSKETGFTNLVLPYFPKGKDVSDLYKSLKNKSDFNIIINNLIN